MPDGWHAPTEQLKQARAVFLRIQPEKGAALLNHINAAGIAEHEHLIHIEKEHRHAMPEQKLYALHQPVLILPAQCLCQPIEDEQPAAGEPCAEHRKPVIIQHRKVGKARLPRMLQPKLPQHIGRGKRF